MILKTLHDDIEEKILQLCIDKGLWVGHTSNYHLSHCVTMSGIFKTLKNQEVNFKNLPYSDFINIDINIDNYNITVYTHKNMKRGYLHYFYYNSDNCFENGEKFKYNIYLPVDDVLDNKPFFTTNIIERRTLKLEKLKNKIMDII